MPLGSVRTPVNRQQDHTDTRAGYKLRKHISQALSRRSRTLRNAVETYNKHAHKHGGQTVRYDDLIQMTDAASFDLIVAGCDSEDLRSQPWARAGVHEAANKWWKLKGARIELKRCHAEVSTLR